MLSGCCNVNDFDFISCLFNRLGLPLGLELGECLALPSLETKLTFGLTLSESGSIGNSPLSSITGCKRTGDDSGGKP
jgi:hypothetical protein